MIAVLLVAIIMATGLGLLIGAIIGLIMERDVWTVLLMAGIVGGVVLIGSLVVAVCCVMVSAAIAYGIGLVVAG